MGNASFVGTIPQHYDEGLGTIVFEDPAADLAKRVAGLAPKRVLETAAGTGILTRALRKVLPHDTEIVATDLNPPMLDAARGKINAGEQVTFLAADATDLPFADYEFDVLACQFGVMFFPDKDKGYREARRVLKPGGHYFFNVWDGHKHNAFGRIAHGVVGSFFPTDPPRFMELPFSYPFEPIKDSLIDAGFTDVTGRIVRFDKPLPNPEVLARGLIFGNPLIEQIRARGEVDPEAIVAAVTAAFVAQIGTDIMPMQALVIEAVA